jgi:hypothetical protein
MPARGRLVERYSNLIDFLVEQLVREAEAGVSPNEKPAASWQTSPRAGVRRGKDNPDHEACATQTALPRV